MIIEELEDDQIALNQLAGTAERSKGLHLSDIIKQMAFEREPERFPKTPDGKPDPMAMMRFEVGFTWEQVLERALHDRTPNLHRPGEFTLDGIIMSPDALDPDGWVLEEWKATWSSTKHDLQDRFWYWFKQIMAYARALKTNVAILRVLYINGDYKPMLPQIKCFRLTFTDRELEENWQEILNFARARGLLPTPASERSRLKRVSREAAKHESRSRTSREASAGVVIPFTVKRGKARVIPFRASKERNKETSDR